MSDYVKYWRMRFDMIEFNDILREHSSRMKHEILFVFCWITQQSALWKQNKNVISFPFSISEQTTRVMWSYKRENRELVCAYCLKTFTNPVKLPCGYNFCEECVLEGWEEEINWERDKEVKWRRRVWVYCEEWYLKRERENGNEKIGYLNEWNELMIDFDVWMIIEMKWYSFISYHSHYFILFNVHN